MAKMQELQDIVPCLLQDTAARENADSCNPHIVFLIPTLNGSVVRGLTDRHTDDQFYYCNR